MVQDHLTQIAADIAAECEELDLLLEETRWRAAMGAHDRASLAPALAACTRRLTALRRELDEVRHTVGRYG